MTYLLLCKITEHAAATSAICRKSLFRFEFESEMQLHSADALTFASLIFPAIAVHKELFSDDEALAHAPRLSLLDNAQTGVQAATEVDRIIPISFAFIYRSPLKKTFILYPLALVRRTGLSPTS